MKVDIYNNVKVEITQGQMITTLIYLIEQYTSLPQKIKHCIDELYLDELVSLFETLLMDLDDYSRNVTSFYLSYYDLSMTLFVNCWFFEGYASEECMVYSGYHGNICVAGDTYFDLYYEFIERMFE